MKKQIINEGYLTHALTDRDGKIYGVIKDCWISDWFIKTNSYYWSDVFVLGNSYHIIRTGTFLLNPTNEKLCQLHEQSKINLND